MLIAEHKQEAFQVVINGTRKKLTAKKWAAIRAFYAKVLAEAGRSTMAEQTFVEHLSRRRPKLAPYYAWLYHWSESLNSSQHNIRTKWLRSENDPIHFECECCGVPMVSTRRQCRTNCAGKLKKELKLRAEATAVEDLQQSLPKLNRELKKLGSTYKFLSALTKSKVKARCTRCGREKEAWPGYLLQYGCLCLRGQKIAETSRRTHEQFLAELPKQNRKLIFKSKYVRANDPIHAVCDKCGHDWRPVPVNLLNGHGCPRCGRSRVIERNLKKYGTKVNPRATASIRETMLRRYGVPHALQNKKLLRKAQSTAYALKPLELNGKTVRVQGYEPQAIQYLVKEKNIPESAIRCGGHASIPEIPYTDETGTHVYHPDIFIPKRNLIVEVKSLYTYRVGKAKIRVTRKACKELGYKFLLLVMNREG